MFSAPSEDDPEYNAQAAMLAENSNLSYSAAKDITNAKSGESTTGYGAIPESLGGKQSFINVNPNFKEDALDFDDTILNVDFDPGKFSKNLGIEINNNVVPESDLTSGNGGFENKNLTKLQDKYPAVDFDNFIKDGKSTGSETVESFKNYESLLGKYGMDFQKLMETDPIHWDFTINELHKKIKNSRNRNPKDAQVLLSLMEQSLNYRTNARSE